MHVRVAESGDADALALLRWEMRTEDGDVCEDAPVFLERYRSSIREDDPTVTRWLAQDGERIIGTTLRLARKELSPDREAADIGYLTNFFVQSGMRNAGIGGALLDALITWARARPIELIIVWPSERSRSIYQRAGFTGASDPQVPEL